MYLQRRVKTQLAVFAVIAVASASIMTFYYAQLPTTLFGVGRYTVTVQLSEAAGLYPRANVTYRGSEVGVVDDVKLTATGVTAVLSLNSDFAIPADVDAAVHSVSAIGEQYVALVPRQGSAARLRNGDVIPVERTSVPPDINTLLALANRGIEAVPQENLRTTVNEAYRAVSGLGPDIARLLQSSSTLAADGRINLEALTSLIDQAPPVLDSQADTADSIHRWAANVAALTGQLQSSDAAVSGLLSRGGPAAAEAARLVERLRPTVPILLANLTSVGKVALAYRNDIEQLLVLVPGGVAGGQSTSLANRGLAAPLRAANYLNLNLNVNLPPPCMTGYLPPTQMRMPALVDYPTRPDGDLYCRIPQDSPFNVRGARNIPCETKPGKRAPTAAMCESDEEYVPLNNGFNWKGDANATLSGQGVPQPRTGTPPATGAAAPSSAPGASAAPPIAAAQYDPATGAYIGPDGKIYQQSDLARQGNPPTWQSMLMPPSG